MLVGFCFRRNVITNERSHGSKSRVIVTCPATNHCCRRTGYATPRTYCSIVGCARQYEQYDMTFSYYYRTYRYVAARDCKKKVLDNEAYVTCRICTLFYEEIYMRTSVTACLFYPINQERKLTKNFCGALERRR